MLSLQSCKKEQTCTCTSSTKTIAGNESSKITNVTVYTEAKKSQAKLLCETQGNTTTSNSTIDKDDVTGITLSESTYNSDGSSTSKNYSEFGILQSESVTTSSGSQTSTSYYENGVTPSSKTETTSAGSYTTTTYLENGTVDDIDSGFNEFWTQNNSGTTTECTLDD